MDSKGYTPLKNERARKYQESKKNLKFLVVDEHSMVGAKMLYRLEQRCREAFTESAERFGGLFVYFFGDIRQLVPVKDTPMFYNIDKIEDIEKINGISIFNHFEEFIELNHSYRQNDSDFVSFLDRLANGQITEEDYTLLSNRREALLSKEEKGEFKDAVYLFPFNKQVEERNDEYLRSTGKPAVIIHSVNSIDANFDAEDVFGLPSKLCLTIGCRVMLRRNLWTEGGLVNGSVGSVTAIIYAEDKEPPELPAYVLVEFDNYKGPYLYNKSIPIVPLLHSWLKNGITFTRLQVPLTVAHALTIYKAQGLTLGKIIVDIGKSERAAGSTYVGLSRVKALTDIMFQVMPSKSRFDSIKNHKSHIAKMRALEKMRSKV